MPAVDHLVESALLVTLAAGSVAILVADRALRKRTPELLGAVIVHLVLFNLLTALGLGLQLVEQGAAASGGTIASLNLLLAHLLVLSVLKIAWLRSFAGLAFALARVPVHRKLDSLAVATAVAAGLASLAGWVGGAASGHPSMSAGVAVATDVVVGCGLVAGGAWLWRRSASAAGLAARQAMRWFAAGNLGIVVLVAASFGARTVWLSWQGQAQSLAHAVILFAYEALLVGWAVRWSGAWAEEARSGAGKGAPFDLAADRFGLSPREREVAALLCRGRTNQEIADQLFVARQTIKDHNYRIFQKAGVRNRTELARRFLDDDSSR